MEARESSSEIRRLLNMRGYKRLGVKDQITDLILEYRKDNKYPGVKIKFLESKSNITELGSWTEYNLLFEILKFEDKNKSVEYLGEMFKVIGSFLVDIKNLFNDIEWSGIQEVECSLPVYYYLLIHIRRDGGI